MAAGDKKLKDPGILIPFHLMSAAIPHVEVAYHADPYCLRSKYGKVYAVGPLHIHGVGSQLLVQVVCDALGKLFVIRFRQDAVELRVIGVLHDHTEAVVIYHIQLIVRYLSRDPQGKKALLVCRLHGNRLSAALLQKGDLGCMGQEALEQSSSLHFMGPQDLLWIPGLRIFDLLNICPVDQMIQLLIHFYFPRFFLFYGISPEGSPQSAPGSPLISDGGSWPFPPDRLPRYP